jgi:hypothetical protein
MLTKEQLNALADKPLVPVKVTTEHGDVYVPRFNAKELTAFLDKAADAAKGVELSYMLVDQYGTRLYGEADADRLERLPASLTVPATRKFNQVNGLVGPKDSATDAASPTG